jgi:hypothetical protein
MWFEIDVSIWLVNENMQQNCANHFDYAANCNMLVLSLDLFCLY